MVICAWSVWFWHLLVRRTRVSAHGSWFSLFKSIFIPFLSRKIADLVTKKEFWMFCQRLAAHDFDWNCSRVRHETWTNSCRMKFTSSHFMLSKRLIRFSSTGESFPLGNRSAKDVIQNTLLHSHARCRCIYSIFPSPCASRKQQSKPAFDGRCQSIASEEFKLYRCQESIYRLCAMTLLYVCVSFACIRPSFESNQSVIKLCVSLAVSECVRLCDIEMEKLLEVHKESKQESTARQWLSFACKQSSI